MSAEIKAKVKINDKILGAFLSSTTIDQILIAGKYTQLAERKNLITLDEMMSYLRFGYDLMKGF